MKRLICISAALISWHFHAQETMPSNCKTPKCQEEKKLLAGALEGDSALKDVAEAVDAGAFLEAKNERGDTALCITSRYYGAPRVMRFLLARGARINAKCGLFQETPFHLAVVYHNDFTVILLGREGADVNKTNHLHEGVLHSLASYSFWPKDMIHSILPLLLHFNVRINTKDKNGNTPLHAAVENNNIDAVDFLMKAGANTYTVNSELKTPYDLAKEKGYTPIIELMKSTKRQDHTALIKDLVNVRAKL